MNILHAPSKQKYNENQHLIILNSNIPHISPNTVPVTNHLIFSQLTASPMPVPESHTA